MNSAYTSLMADEKTKCEQLGLQQVADDVQERGAHSGRLLAARSRSPPGTPGPR